MHTSYCMWLCNPNPILLRLGLAKIGGDIKKKILLVILLVNFLLCIETQILLRKGSLLPMNASNVVVRVILAREPV